MDIQNVSRVLKENDVYYNAKFVHVLEDGCVVDYQSLLESAVKKVEELTIYGVNYGFSNKVKEEIKDMTDFAIKLTKEKNGKAVNRFKSNYDKNEKECDKLMVNTNQVTLKSELLKWIDDYVKGSQVLIMHNAGNNRNVYLQDGINKLYEIKNALDNVVDVSSLQAEECAVNVLKNIKLWGAEVVDNLHHSKSIEKLEESLVAVKDWANLTASVKKGLFKSKTVEDGGKVKYSPDTMYKIKMSQPALEKLIVFEDCLKESLMDIAERYSVTEIDDSIKEAKESLLKIEKKKQDLFASANRGEITFKELEDEVNFLEMDVVDYNRELARLSEEKRRNEYIKRNNQSAIKSIKTISSKIKSYRSDLQLLVYFCDLFKMESAIKVIRGTANEEEFDYILKCDERIRDIEEEICKRSATLREKIYKLRAESTINVNPVKVQNVSEQAKLEEEEARKRMMEKFGVKPTVVVEPEVEKPVKISDVNDII